MLVDSSLPVYTRHKPSSNFLYGRPVIIRQQPPLFLVGVVKALSDHDFRHCQKYQKASQKYMQLNLSAKHSNHATAQNVSHSDTVRSYSHATTNNQHSKPTQCSNLISKEIKRNPHTISLKWDTSRASGSAGINQYPVLQKPTPFDHRDIHIHNHIRNNCILRQLTAMSNSSSLSQQSPQVIFRVIVGETDEVQNRACRHRNYRNVIAGRKMSS